MKILVYVLLTSVVLLTGIGCASREERAAEERTERLKRDVDRELERAEEEISELRDRLEDQLDRKLSDEELDKISREVSNSVERGITGIGEALERIGSRLKEDANVTVVDYREFRELVPDEVAGFRLVKENGSNKSALGIRFSKLEAQYKHRQGAAYLDLAILDLGTMKGITSMGFDWIDREIDSEDLNGFERTTKFGGYPGFESAEFQGSHVKTHGVVIVEKRFVVVVNAEGQDLEKNVLEKVFDEISFRKLRQMAN